MPQTVILWGCPDFPPEEIASESITPGHLVEFVPSGGSAGQLRKHATANGDAAPYFAVESLVPSIANSQTAPIDLAYASADSVRWVTPDSGDGIYAWVPASASAIKKGDQLCSNGDGTLRKYTAQASNEGGTATYTIQARAVVARAAEDKDNSSNSASAVRIRVRTI